MSELKNKFLRFAKKETVFLISFLAALVSAFIVKPSSDYIEYINFSVLELLFCLMAAVEGLKQNGIFSLTANSLLKNVKNTRMLSIVLSSICFFASMLITNDVSLIAFVPLTIMLTKDNIKDMTKIIAIETVAANLGSMLTPIGNPQNLFIYENSGMNAGSFVITMLPLSIISYLMILLSCFIVSKKEITTKKQNTDFNKKGSLICGLLFTLCILTVLHIVPYIVCTIATIVVLIIYNKKILANVDYMLLLTFVCFFVFSGNLAAIPQAESFLSGFMKNYTLETSLLCSQVISNVPSTVLLYPFCENIKELLYGVDIGGLGTLVASLASLISYRFFSAEKNISKSKYLAIFTLLCIIFIVVLYAVAKILL